jgi:hypothetical protein
MSVLRVECYFNGVMFPSWFDTEQEYNNFKLLNKPTKDLDIVFNDMMNWCRGELFNRWIKWGGRNDNIITPEMFNKFVKIGDKNKNSSINYERFGFFMLRFTNYLIDNNYINNDDKNGITIQELDSIYENNNNYMTINTSKTKFRRCAVCNIKCSQKCLFCGLIFYCDKSHQLNDWKRHKELCKKVKEQNLNK